MTWTDSGRPSAVTSGYFKLRGTEGRRDGCLGMGVRKFIAVMIAAARLPQNLAADADGRGVSRDRVKREGVLSGGGWPRPRSGVGMRRSSASRDAVAAAIAAMAARLRGWLDVLLILESACCE